MKTWTDEMHEQAAAAARDRLAKRAAEQATKAAIFTRRTTPMEERLRRILRAMPDSECGKARHIKWFANQLKAKFPDKGYSRAAVGEIGPALANLGWTRHRVWLGAHKTYRTEWVPPSSKTKQENAA